MQIAPRPADEGSRLAALQRLGILDTPPEERFDRITRLAAIVLDMPMAALSFVDEDRQWWKSTVGLTGNGTPRNQSFCAHAIADPDLGDEAFVVPDALGDHRFFDNPIVTGDPYVRAYAGQVVRDRSGAALGMLCTLDREPRQPSRRQLAALADLAAMAEEELARREHEDLTLWLERFHHLFQHANDIITVVDATGTVRYSSPSSERVLGYPEDYRHPDGILGLVHPDDLGDALERLERLAQGRAGDQPFTVRVRDHQGHLRTLECVGVNLLDEPSVHGIVLTARDVTERARLTEQLTHLAEHDHLTDLANRAMLASRLDAALARAMRDDRQVAICYIDLDQFKAVNDTHGHAAGDDLLLEVADRIRSATRAGDMAARIGGDEFVIVLDPVLGTDESLEAARRIRDALIEPPLNVGDVRVGASVGVSVSGLDDTAATLLARADRALYEAKVVRASSVAVALADGRTKIVDRRSA